MRITQTMKITEFLKDYRGCFSVYSIHAEVKTISIPLINKVIRDLVEDGEIFIVGEIFQNTKITKPSFIYSKNKTDIVNEKFKQNHEIAKRASLTAVPIFVQPTDFELCGIELQNIIFYWGTNHRSVNNAQRC